MRGSCGQSSLPSFQIIGSGEVSAGRSGGSRSPGFVGAHGNYLPHRSSPKWTQFWAVKGSPLLGALWWIFFMSYVGVALSELGREQEELGWGRSHQLSGPLSLVIKKIPSWGTASLFTAAMTRAFEFISYIWIWYLTHEWLAHFLIHTYQDIFIVSFLVVVTMIIIIICKTLPPACLRYLMQLSVWCLAGTALDHGAQTSQGQEVLG